jgi:glycosyltransferase involved in cell wall biosynthesis
MKVSELPPSPAGRTGWPWTEGEPEARCPSLPGGTYPKITIVTPSFNQGQYLEETIRSVLLQDYPELDYMVIDGGSTDESVKIIQKYEKHLSYWISEKDNGQSHAINKGFARATGEWLGWLNSDDAYLPGALSWLAAKAREGPEVAWVAGAVDFIGPEPGVRLQQPGASLIEWLTHQAQFSQPGAFWRRDVMERLGPLVESMHYSFDWELWCRLVAHGLMPLCDARPVARFREHAASKSCLRWDRFCAENEAILDRFLPRLSVSERRRAERRRLQFIALRLTLETKRFCEQGMVAAALGNLWITVVGRPRLLVKRVPYSGTVQACATALSRWIHGAHPHP